MTGAWGRPCIDIKVFLKHILQFMLWRLAQCPDQNLLPIMNALQVACRRGQRFSLYFTFDNAIYINANKMQRPRDVRPDFGLMCW